MGKVELRFEVDADLLERLETAGVDPAKAAEAGLRDALAATPRPLGLVESARAKAGDPQGAERRAREWAETNREAIAEHNRWVADRGVLADYDAFKPDWMR